MSWARTPMRCGVLATCASAASGATTMPPVSITMKVRRSITCLPSVEPPGPSKAALLRQQPGDVLPYLGPRGRAPRVREGKSQCDGDDQPRAVGRDSRDRIEGRERD